MKITVFDLYVCGLLLRVFSGRAPSADCAVCGAGVRAGRGGVGGQYGGHATCGRTAHTHSRHPSLGCLRVVTLSINCLDTESDIALLHLLISYPSNPRCILDEATLCLQLGRARLDPQTCAQSGVSG